ncbi:phage head spike fiber domain-containing protein [Companilactobacillus pabuli]|uniref:phage head spike fiber domain-containing protein n=1 Tax=Companilactobacillus pabuli TaxID=2714036 RepID=UPI00241712CE|nr:phage tail protein [Companilactobacillus pabuli]MDG5112795.1 phage tail protein [Companilactobacillus pabuli]
MSLPSIILDTDKTTPIYELPLKIRQGDTGDELQVTLGKSFQKYTDLSTVDIELIAKTPDQRLIKQPVTDKSGNTFKVKFPDEIYTNVGVFRNMYFKIGDDSTSSVKLVVLQGIGSIKEAGSYIDDFETLIKEAESYVLALKDFSDTGNARIDNKVAELTGKMTDFMDKSKEDLDAAKSAWSTFQSNSQTAFKDAQDKRASDFNSQKAGFETDFGKQKADFENRFKALLATLQGDYDDFKNLINKDVADFNTSLDSLDAQETDVKNKFDALKAQLDLAAQNISGVRTNLYADTRDFDNPSVWTDWSHWHKNGEKFNGLTVMRADDNWGRLRQTIPVKKGETYTYSVYARYKSGTGKSIIVVNPSDRPSNTDISDSKVYLDENWKRVSLTVSVTTDGTIEPSIERFNSNTNTLLIAGPKLEKGPTATDYSLNPLDIVTDGSVQTSIKNALGNYSTTAEVDSKVSTGVGQAKTYAEQSIKDIIGAAPATLDTIEELADAVTKNKDGVQAINEGITKKADKTELANYESKAEVISQTDYEAKKTAGTLENKFYIVTDDTEAS